ANGWRSYRSGARRRNRARGLSRADATCMIVDDDALSDRRPRAGARRGHRLRRRRRAAAAGARPRRRSRHRKVDALAVGRLARWRAGAAPSRARERGVPSPGPAEAEQGLAHAALGDLLEDAFAEVAPRLALPRRRALEIALLLTPPGEQALDPRTLGVAVRDA